ncbi:MAG: hypothetical protein EXR75_01005 [Myxococcales bacterium]|nr:hypothetical protein [Myxococcales bacterium]
MTRMTRMTRMTPAKMMTRASLLLLALGGVVGACAAADTSSDTGASGAPQVCVPGHQTICACFGGTDGIQQCLADGSGLGECDCGISSGSGGNGGSMPCGDGTCAMDENCHTCEADCKKCEPCELAPSCKNAFVPPLDPPNAAEFNIAKMEWLSREKLQARLVKFVAEAGPAMRVVAASLDVHARADEHPLVTELRRVFAADRKAHAALVSELGKAGMGSPASFRAAHPERRGSLPPMTVLGEFDAPPGGTVECGAPLLRIGVASVKVYEEDDDIGNDEVYCVIQAEAMTGAEVRITPKTKPLDEDEVYNFALESGVFWGQKGPLSPAGNLIVTYDCIESDTGDGYQKLVDSIGNAATKVGDVVPGDNGWIFTTVGAIAPIVSSGLSLNGDDQLFNAQQIIPLDKQLELTNGRYWTVRRAGTHNFSDWDWELRIQAWGCAEFGTL